MSEIFYRITMMLVFVGIFIFGGKLNSETYKYTAEKPRTMEMVDAFEYYSDAGKPGWTGIFRDKEFNTRLENPIEPKTFRDFIASNSAPRDMVVRASLSEVKDPKAPEAQIFWSKALMMLGFFCFWWHFFAVLFFRERY